MAIRSTSASVAPEHHPINPGRTTKTPPNSFRGRGKRSDRPNSRRHRLRTFIIAGAAAVMLSGSSGCSMLSNAYRQVKKCDCLDDFMIAHRNKVFAAKAWLREKHCHQNHPQLAEFKAGFLQGYADVADGSNGCLPCVAPSQYWGWKYQSPGGQAAIDAWFAGYPLGVKAAEQDGVGYWGRAPMVAHHSPAPTDSLSSDAPTEAPLLGPDGKPIPPEIIVPGSTKIIERTIPNEVLDFEMLDPPVQSLSEPIFDPQDLAVPAIGDGAALDQRSTEQTKATEFVDDSANLVPRQTAAVYSLNDLPGADSTIDDDAIEGIFGSVEMPGSLNSASTGSSGSYPQSVPSADVNEAVNTASAADDEIPFKFE